ncbi:MAG: SRPBCC domain-containing protein [Chitinophagaceae bacterium]|nr:MAG: SRPBCC domain-containing protein [Chitinophagaceae bacterium]
MNDNTVFVEDLIDAPVADVWNALTDQELMKQWYFTVDDFRAEKGFVFRFSGQGSKGENYNHVCTITEVIPEKKLQHTWTYDTIPGNSLVTFELIPEGNSTRLQLTHEGLDTFPKDSPDFAKASFKQGWTEIITVNLAGFFKNRD